MKAAKHVPSGLEGSGVVRKGGAKEGIEEISAGPGTVIQPAVTATASASAITPKKKLRNEKAAVTPALTFTTIEKRLSIIKEHEGSNMSHRQLAKKFNVSKSSVTRILADKKRYLDVAAAGGPLTSMRLLEKAKDGKSKGSSGGTPSASAANKQKAINGAGQKPAKRLKSGPPGLAKRGPSSESGGQLSQLAASTLGDNSGKGLVELKRQNDLQAKQNELQEMRLAFDVFSKPESDIPEESREFFKLLKEKLTAKLRDQNVRRGVV